MSADDDPWDGLAGVVLAEAAMMVLERNEVRRGMVSESKKREVLQLLKDYRAWHTPHGGAMPLDETGVIDASYGPAGLIEAGQGFQKKHRARLARTYETLDHVLKLLKSADHDLWIALHRPYLSETADPSIVAAWRRKAEQGNEDARGAVELYDWGVRVLWRYFFTVTTSTTSSRSACPPARRSRWTG